MRSTDTRDDRNSKVTFTRAVVKVERIRLLAGLAVSLIVLTVLIVSVDPGATQSDNSSLSQAMMSGREQVEIDSDGLTGRVVEQKFQIHMEEMDQQAGEIPYVEIWVLNDPFYPLLGDVGDLREEDGILSSKEWQMLGFPDYDIDTGTTAGAPAPSSPTGSLPVTTGVTQHVVMVEEIYELRGIRYADIRVDDVTYDKLKAGSEFADVFRLQEITGERTLTVLCGDETYELEVEQLRKI